LPDAVALAAAAAPGVVFAAAHRRGDLLLLRTSGTVGRPRGVLRTAESWACSFPAYSGFAELDAGARLWVPGPRASTMNLFALVHAHAVGATVVGSSRGATHAVLTPTALARALVDGAARPGLRAVVAGCQLPARLRDQAVAAGVRVRHYYGASELSFVACGDGADDLRPFPGVELAIRAGRIWVRSPYLALGYDRPGGPLVVGPDGFACVGDVGELRDGRLVVTGRGDAVVTGGATVLLADVEGVVRAAATGGIAVVGLPHAYLGTVLVCAAEHVPDLSAARAAARAELSAAQRPRLWCHVPRLPVTPAGKLDRRTLGRLVAAARDRRGPVRFVVPPAPP
jgi:long-chain acyl-CoA synthetase